MSTTTLTATPPGARIVITPFRGFLWLLVASPGCRQYLQMTIGRTPF